MNKILGSVAKLEQRLKRAGWDGVRTTAEPMEHVKKEYPEVHWVMKDRESIYGVDPEHKDFVVCLYKVKKEKGERWIDTKIMDGKMGPFARPPAKFWEDSFVKEHLPSEYIEKQRSEHWNNKSGPDMSPLYESMEKLKKTFKKEAAGMGWTNKIIDHSDAPADISHLSRGEKVSIDWDRLLGDSHGAMKPFYKTLYNMVGKAPGKIDEVKNGLVFVYFPQTRQGGDFPAEFVKGVMEQPEVKTSANKKAVGISWVNKITDHDTPSEVPHLSRGEKVFIDWEKLLSDSHGAMKTFYKTLFSLVGQGAGKIEEVKNGLIFVYFPQSRQGGDFPAEFVKT